MASKLLTALTPVKNTGPSKRYVFACDFGSSGELQIKTATSTSFITVKTFSADEAVEVLIPGNAEYQVTGDSEITANYDA